MTNHSEPHERSAHEYGLGRNGRNHEGLVYEELYDLSRSGKEGFVCLYVALGLFMLVGCLAGWLLHIWWLMWWLI